MLALMRSPYFDPWTRHLFGEGGLEGNLHPKLDPLAQIGGVAGGVSKIGKETPAHFGGVTGGVIMSKLGNETAKYAKNHPLWAHFTNFH